MKFGLLAIVVAVLLVSCSSEEPRPPLVQGLHGSVTQITADFDQRIKERFPVGSSAQALSTELAAEGFLVTPNIPGEARREYSHFPCVDDWIVSWRTTGGNITEVRGNYWMTCP